MSDVSYLENDVMFSNDELMMAMMVVVVVVNTCDE